MKKAISDNPLMTADRITDRSVAMIVARVIMAVPGCYVFSWFFAAAGVALLYMAGTDYQDAEKVMMMAAPLVYLAVFLWTFSVRRFRHACFVIVIGSALFAWAALALQRFQLG